MDELATRYPGLIRRPGSANWYFRARVPHDVREAFGRNEVWVSLGTAELNKAKDAWLIEHAKWLDKLDALRAPSECSEPGRPSGCVGQGLSRVERIRALRRERGGAGLRPLQAGEALKLATQWFRAEADRRLVDGTAQSTAEGIEDQLEEAAILRDSQHPDTLIWTQRAADLLLEENGLAGTPGELEYGRLAEYLRRAMLELARRDLARLQGDFREEGHDHLFTGTTAPTALPAPASAAAMTVQETAEGFWAERREHKRMDEKTRQKYRAGLDLAVAFLGSQTPIADISRQHCKKFLDLLRRLPPNYAKAKREKALEQIIAEAAKRRGGGLSYNSQQGYFRQFRDMLRWAVDEGHPVRFSLDGLTVERRADDDEGKRRRPFTTAELQRIFQAPLFTGCVDDGRGFNRPGPNRPRRARFWLPLLGLWTGARLGELCQLRPVDIQVTASEVPYIRITDEGEGMSIKTPAARRSIPVHPELVRIGFLRFARKQRDAGAAWLFPEVLRPDRENCYLASKRFASLRAALKLERENVCFHSFRHGFRDALRRAEVSEEIAEALGGWSEGKKTSRHYGSGFIADTLAPSIQKLSFPDLDLTSLYESA